MAVSTFYTHFMSHIFYSYILQEKELATCQKVRDLLLLLPLSGEKMQRDGALVL